MPRQDPYTPEPPFEYECPSCGSRLRAEHHPGECPDCEIQLQDVSVPRE